MIRFLCGCGVGFVAGYLLGPAIPPQAFLVACLALVALAALLFLLFHLGVQDFQEY